MGPKDNENDGTTTGDNVVVLGMSADEVEQKKRARVRRLLDATDNTPAKDPLLAAVTGRATLFRDEQGNALAAVRSGGRTELLEISGKRFDLWLRRVLHEEQIHVTRCGRRDLQEQLESVALFEGKSEPVFTRLGEADNHTVYVDLALASDEAVRVIAGSWRIVAAPPVRFRSGSGMQALPRPDAGCAGAARELHAFLNVDEQQFHVIVGWILAALRPHGPYPILVLQGEQGTGKSTAARIISSLVDPRATPLRTLPRSERDLAVAARHARALCYDNLSGISTAMSDALCRMSTGGGLSTRKLYTDANEVVLEASRPLLLTGIDEIATRPDLAERSIILRLPVVRERIDEVGLMRGFRGAAPRIFGSILDGVAAALAGAENVTVPELPRMADFAKWVTAAEPGLRWPPGTIATAFGEIQNAQKHDAFHADAVAPLVPRLLELTGRNAWQGTPTDLFALLRPLSKAGHDFPRAPNALTAHLGAIAPILRANGFRFRSNRTATERSVILERSS